MKWPFISFPHLLHEAITVTAGWSIWCPQVHPLPSQLCPISWGCLAGSFLCICSTKLPTDLSQWEALRVGWRLSRRRLQSITHPSPHLPQPLPATVPSPWLCILLDGPLALENPELGFLRPSFLNLGTIDMWGPHNSLLFLSHFSAPVWILSFSLSYITNTLH